MHAVTTVAETQTTSGVIQLVLRSVDAVLSLALLVLAAPLMLVLALAVRRSSHGPVLRREPSYDRRGRAVTLLSFRTHVDGAHSEAHERVRSVLGSHTTLTGVGRVMLATRLNLLPRLVNVTAGHTGLVARS